MGATASTPVTAYAVPVSDPREGESAVFRHTNYRDELLGVCKFGDGDEARTLAQAFEHGVKVSKDRPCYGYRPIRPDGSAGEYLWATFGEAHTRIINFARGIEKLQCCPVNPDDKLKKLGIYSRNRMEWAIAMQACYKTNVVVVPLYDTLGPEAVEYVLRQAEISTVVCTSKELSCLAKVKESGQCPTFSRIILIDDTEDAGPFTGESLLKFSQVEDSGSQAEDIDLAALAPTPENIAMFCYTSGTTGDPKGAMESHGSILADAAGAISGGLALTPEDVHLSYLPLAHMFEVAVQNMMSAHGGAVGFFQGDTLKLTDDIAALRPTIFPSVPRLYNRIYDKIMSGVQTQGGVKAFMFNQAYAAKKEGLKAGVLTHGMWDPLVFKKVAARVGLDRCRLMVTGSAPIAGHVMEFLRIVFSCPVQEGYGQTECAAALSITHPNDLTVGHVGGPLPCNEVKLVDVADMGYTAKDQPNPRGEVCCRGPNVFPGYYKMEEKTREAIDEEGWLHTGDIGVIMPNGAIKIIDRKKNIFKLSQGEYVAAEKIENVYIKSPLIMQCFVYGDSLQSCLVGIIVPDPEQFKTWAAEHGGTEDLEKLKGPMLKYLDTVGKEGGLKGFELVKAIHIEASPWTVEEPQSVLTPTFKLKRVDAKKRYQAQIDAMYSSGISTVAGKTGLKQGED